MVFESIIDVTTPTVIRFIFVVNCISSLKLFDTSVHFYKYKKMISRVKRAPRVNEPFKTNRKEVHVNLNDESKTLHCARKHIRSLFQRCGGLVEIRTSLG